MKVTTETTLIFVPSVQSKGRVWPTLRLSAIQSRGKVGSSSKLAARNQKYHLNSALVQTFTLERRGFDRHKSVKRYNSKIMENDSKGSVLCSDRADVVSIDGQMNFCGDGQFNNCLYNNITTTAQVSASVPHCAPPHFNNALLSCHNNVNVLYNIDRFNYWFPDTLDNADFYYVYTHNFPQYKPGGFYYLRLCRTSGRITVHACDGSTVGL